MNIIGCAKLGSDALEMVCAGITFIPYFVKTGQMIQHGELLSIVSLRKESWLK
jgi:hypothetical protein